MIFNQQSFDWCNSHLHSSFCFSWLDYDAFYRQSLSISVTRFLSLNQANVELRLTLKSELTEILRSIESQRPREVHSSKHVLLVNTENYGFPNFTDLQ